MENYKWKLHLKLSILFSVVFYLIVSFIFFDITIIKQLPYIGEWHRIFITWFYLSFQTFLTLYVYNKSNPK